MFSFGGSEFLIVVVVALLLFGPDKIPQLARTIGRFTREFNKYKSIMESTLSAEIYKSEGATKDEISMEDRIAKAGAASTAFTESRMAADAPDEESELGDDAPAVAPVAAPRPEPKPKPTAAPSADEADEEDEE